MSLPPLLHIYIGPIDALQTDPAHIACEERRALVAAPQHEDLRRSRIADWRLLQLGLRHAFGVDEADLHFRREANGRWTCDGPSFSLTHTEHYAACAVSDRSVGVDAEEPALFAARFRTERMQQRMAQTICTPGELSSGTDLMILWLMKESIFKIEGGMSFRPGRIDTARPDVRVISLKPALPLHIAAAGERVGLARVFLCGADSIDELRI